MKFIGNKSNNFNIKLLDELNIVDYTVISYIDHDFIYNSSDKNIIQILPIINEVDYFKSIDLGWQKMVQSAFYDDLSICTSIFVIMPEKNDPINVAKIINNFDRVNLIDNIWIYPSPIHNYQLRNTIVQELPWQNRHSKLF